MAVTAAALVLVFGGLTVWGGLRMTTETEGPTARLAAIVMPAEEGGPQSMVEVFDNRLTSPYDQTIARIEAMVAEAAGTGAEIVSLSEFAIVVNESDNARARAAFVRIASENGVWLSVPYAWIPEEGKGENRHLLISDTGEILLDYQKRYLQGLGDMGETAVFVRGPTVVQWADTPFGRIAVAICKDASFPRFFLQAGQAGVDIMLVGSHEFPRGLYLNDPYRAVENGFTHVRTTYDGFTYAMDPFGRVLAQMNRGVGEAGIMYVDVPTQGVGTLYARFGDWLGWGSVGLTVLLILAAAVFGRGPGPVAEARGIH
jgi:apolipoprotein N-acyltransferase